MEMKRKKSESFELKGRSEMFHCQLLLLSSAILPKRFRAKYYEKL